MNEDYVEVVWKIVERSKGTGVSVVLLFCTTEHSYGITRGCSTKYWRGDEVHLDC